MQVDELQTSVPRVVDGIVCHLQSPSTQTNPDYPPEGLEKLFAVESDHFWFKTRRHLICRTVLQYLTRPARILEVGAGTGYVAKGLQNEGYDVTVGEYYLSGLRFAQARGIHECHQMDIFNPPFSEIFDAVGLFDVLEHFERDELALESCRNMLKPGGLVFVTVPAHQWLWNRKDRVAGHKRRYNKDSLASIASMAGFELIDVRYFFVAILPFLVLRAVITPDHPGAVTPAEREEDIGMNAIANAIFEKISILENRFQKLVPNIAGGSLLLVARKPKRSVDLNLASRGLGIS